MPYVDVECTYAPLIRHGLVTQSQGVEQIGGIKVPQFTHPRRIISPPPGTFLDYILIAITLRVIPVSAAYP